MKTIKKIVLGLFLLMSVIVSGQYKVHVEVNSVELYNNSNDKLVNVVRNLSTISSSESEEVGYRHYIDLFYGGGRSLRIFYDEIIQIKVGVGNYGPPVSFDDVVDIFRTNIVNSTSGITNITYTSYPTNGIVHSDTGSDATIPLANSTNAGLLNPTDYTKLTTVGVNVKWFGAIGDGVADDTSAIQACINAQPNNTTINFGDGNTYLVGSAGIAILNKTGIKLTGKSIIKYTSQSALVVQALGRAGIRFTGCTNSGVDGMVFDGNSIVQAAIGFDNCLEEYVSNCEVYGCASAVAQLVSAKAVKCTYNNNIVRNANGGSCRGIWIGNLTIAEQATNVKIYNNIVFSNTATGIVCTSVGGIVYGNNVYSNAGSGIIFSGGNGMSAKNINCYGNICTDNLFYGIQSDVVYTVDADLIVDININGNNCSRNSGGGILMTHSTRLSVVGNTCNDNNYDNVGNGGGIECDNHTYNAIISGNTCSDTRVGGARTQSYGVRCVANTYSPKMISISNNICENNTSIGIYAESTGVLTITDLSIIGNTCNNNSSRGIFLNEAVAGQITSTVTNNRCSGNTTTDMRISALNVLLANNVLVTQQDVRYFDFPALATTPTVGARSLFRANNASATTITNFLSPYEGQEVSVLGANANTTLAQGTFQLKGAVNILIPNNGIITLQYQGAVWREKARSF